MDGRSFAHAPRLNCGWREEMSGQLHRQSTSLRNGRDHPTHYSTVLICALETTRRAPICDPNDARCHGKHPFDAAAFGAYWHGHSPRADTDDAVLVRLVHFGGATQNARIGVRRRPRSTDRDASSPGQRILAMPRTRVATCSHARSHARIRVSCPACALRNTIALAGTPTVAGDRALVRIQPGGVGDNVDSVIRRRK